MDVVTQSLIMLVMVVISGYLSRSLPWPIPIALIQIGLGALVASFSQNRLSLEPEFFFLLFIPPLLFLDGWLVSKTGLKENKFYIFQLALGLVIFTVLGLGYFIHWLIPSMPLGVAFALAAILSPTDPVAVSGIAARIPIPKRALHILEGESLFNDASGLVCFKFAVAAVLTGVFSFSSALWTLLWTALAGISLGIATTISIESIKVWLGRYVEEDVGTHILISLLIPFAAYLLAEHVHSSGILAVVAAGVTMSYSEASGRAQALTRLQRRTIWDMLKFVLNGVLFVLLGEQFPALFASASAATHEAGHSHIIWLLLAVLLITTALIALRFIWGWLVIRLTWLVDHTQQTARQINWRILLMMSVAGVRGAVTLAGVLTLPLFMPDGSPFPTRDLAIFIAGGVIILSLIIASVSIPWLLRSPSIDIEPHTLPDEILIANQASQEAALAKLALLNEQYRDNPLYQQALSTVLQDYQKTQSLQPLSVQEKRQLEKVHKLSKQIKRQVLDAQRSAIFKLVREHQISDDCMRHLIQHLDLLEIQL